MLIIYTVGSIRNNLNGLVLGLFVFLHVCCNDAFRAICRSEPVAFLFGMSVSKKTRGSFSLSEFVSMQISTALLSFSYQLPLDFRSSVRNSNGHVGRAKQINGEKKKNAIPTLLPRFI